jgi:hypothetical protein
MSGVLTPLGALFHFLTVLRQAGEMEGKKGRRVTNEALF